MAEEKEPKPGPVGDAIKGAQPEAAGISGLAGLATGAIQSSVGFGLGFALSEALGPLATQIKQTAYGTDPTRALNPEDAAQAVAQALKEIGWGETEAGNSGINAGRFDLLHETQLIAPPVGTLIELIRRGVPSDKQVTHALRKSQFEPAWDKMLRGLAVAPLAPGEVSTAVHRGIMVGPDLIVTSPPTTPGKVPIVPPTKIDPVQQAAWWGLDHEKLRVLVGITGLPLALGEMLQLHNRGKVTADDVKRAVAESNIRNEYMDVALNLARRLLTPHEYAEAELRGVKTRADAQAGAGLSGLDAGDYATLFEIMGRPLNIHEITTALARGGKFGGDYSTVPEPYQDAIRRSAIRPEYAHLAYANRYTYPSAFVLRSLVQGGELTPAEGHEILLEIGWRPDLAEKVAHAWGGGGGTASGKHVGKAQTQLWTTTHGSYKGYEISDTTATAALGEAGVDSSEIPQVLSLWKAERELVRKQLSAANIKKAYVSQATNPATGAKWTQPDALARLAELGYSTQDAQTYLEL